MYTPPFRGWALTKTKIRVAIAGVGNCASSLVQGVAAYSRPNADTLGLAHPEVGGYRASDIEFVAAFDVDERKVGRPLEEAIFAPPNCTKVFHREIPKTDVTVRMAPVLDGVSEHMKDFPPERTFVVAKAEPVDVVRTLRDARADVLISYVPVGSEQAARFYAQACLDTGASFLNCMPAFIVSNPEWAARFREAGIPVVGDDVKSQLGATVLHRTLAQLFLDRGVKVDRTYQLNTGGNTDFLNMLNRARLGSKKISKTRAVKAILGEDFPNDNVHIGPSDYVPWQNDNKISYIRLEGRGFGGVPLNVELRLSDEDSPNSGGMVIDAVRCLKLARDRKVSGPLVSVCACTMKSPPEQHPDRLARQMLNDFIDGKRER